MNILVTQVFEDQMKEILEEMIETNPDSVKGFKIYLDTILLNIPTKDKKYKKSVIFDNENIKDVEHEGFRIPFYHNKQKNTFIILGIIKI
ncbi:hypothetical protein [Sulfurimonas microaerophilic]|uniref:hypothetical protein n=1 Tax=Sulfurimonas microaerophilic TaxID=3058392 RepID=UPI0027155ADB|nr:hypothetical protein [Sulfurimonas sp. hsl 1-7]